jgi:hypothetical protein
MGGDGYAELNFSPAGAWAAYQFDSYRAGMRPLAIAVPEIDVRPGADALYLAARVVLPFGDLGAWRVGLSAVVEAQDGALSYWALCAAADAPDFHLGSCFALELPPPA